MNTFNNKIFEILSDLINIIVEGTVLETNPEKKKPNSWYPTYLHNVVIDGYWRDPQRDKLSDAIAGITPEKISTSIRLYLNQHDYLGGLKYLAECCGCSEEAIKEFGILYQTPIMETEDDNSELLSRIAELEKTLAERDAEIARLNALLNQNKIAFTKDNITAESIKTARVVLRKGNRIENYQNLETLLEEEEITLSKPYEEIARMLRAQTGDKFRYFQQSAKTRIDFYF